MMWGECKFAAGCVGAFDSLALFLETDNCFNPTLQLSGANCSLTHCEVRGVMIAATF